MANYNAEKSARKNDSDKWVTGAFAIVIIAAAIIAGVITKAWVGPLVSIGLIATTYFAYQKTQETLVAIIGFGLAALALIVVVV